jgi:hypothetical protein
MNAASIQIVPSKELLKLIPLFRVSKIERLGRYDHSNEYWGVEFSFKGTEAAKDPTYLRAFACYLIAWLGEEVLSCECKCSGALYGELEWRYHCDCVVEVTKHKD